MKTRTKRNVVYHAEPQNAWSFMAKSEVLRNKLNRGTITPEELKELASFNVENGVMTGQVVSAKYNKKPSEEHPKYVTVTIYGSLKKKVTWDEYVREWKDRLIRAGLCHDL